MLEDQENIIEQTPEIDYKAEYEKHKLSVEKLTAKNQELIQEKQKEAEKRRNAESQVENERIEKLKKDGDYESVVKSAQQKQQEWEKKFNELNTKIAQKEVRQAAMRLANELEPLDADAGEIIADYIEKRIKYNGENFSFLDANGDPSVMDSQQLKDEFRNSNKFKPLLVGSRASGGGAPGSKNSANGVNTISRATFSNMDVERQAKFMKNGGKLTD